MPAERTAAQYAPVSQDKILQSGSKNETIQVTNDGATILKSISVDNPAAKVLIGETLAAPHAPRGP